MLKKVILFVCVACLVLSLCSCRALGEKGEENSTTHISASETTEKTELSDWKKAYLDFLESEKANYASFALIYIDNDNIPELYLSGIGEATGDRICSYKNGRVVEQGLWRLGGGKYIERSGEFANLNGHMGHSYSHVFKLTEKGFEQTFSADSIERVEILENGEYELSYEYSIGDESVGETEYHAAVDASFDISQALDMDENKVEYDEIRQQIMDVKTEDNSVS